MNKQQIADFLATHPSREEQNKQWDQHLKDEKYQSGMYMCNCGCFRFTWKTPDRNGVVYKDGHQPRRTTSARKPPRKQFSFEQLNNILLIILGLIGVIFFLMAK